MYSVPYGGELGSDETTCLQQEIRPHSLSRCRSSRRLLPNPSKWGANDCRESFAWRRYLRRRHRELASRSPSLRENIGDKDCPDASTQRSHDGEVYRAGECEEGGR